jgi:hypothetical protein
MKLRRKNSVRHSETQQQPRISSSMLNILDRKIEELLDCIESQATDVSIYFPSLSFFKSK